MIVLFTDFGTRDPYVGQMHAALRRRSDAAVVDLLHHAPDFDARAGAFLLAALQGRFPPGDVFVCVVDPGVGGDRAPVMVKADGKWFVGPDNGLLNTVARRAGALDCFRIDWRPEELSASFHGRDIFAPAAAELHGGGMPACTPCNLTGLEDWPEALAEIIYIDHYGNAMTGLQADALSPESTVTVKGRHLLAARTFAAVSPGETFWYRNSIDLVEIAAREASAASLLDLQVGDSVAVTDYRALLADQP